LTWREMDNDFVEIGCFNIMKGVMLPEQRNIMNVVDMDNGIDVMICLLPLGEAKGGGQPNYIVK
jgi:hypothetical protein